MVTESNLCLRVPAQVTAWTVRAAAMSCIEDIRSWVFCASARRCGGARMGRWQAVGEIQIGELVPEGYEDSGSLINALTRVARWARERRKMLRPRPWCVTFRFLLRGPVSRSVRKRGLVGSGFSGEGFLGEVTQDSFVEGGQGVEFGGGEQVDEMPADVVYVLGRGILNDPASGGQQADHDAAGIGRVGLADDQSLLLHAPDLVG